MFFAWDLFWPKDNSICRMAFTYKAYKPYWSKRLIIDYKKNFKMKANIHGIYVL